MPNVSIVPVSSVPSIETAVNRPKRQRRLEATAEQITRMEDGRWWCSACMDGYSVLINDHCANGHARHAKDEFSVSPQ